MLRFTPRKTLIAAALSTAVAAPAAFAQLEEVIVTAQKREESLQDTAIAITAIGNDAFDSMNISAASDYEAFVPSLTVRTVPERLSLRGVGRITNTLGTDPGVAVYIDQMYTDDIEELNRASSLTTQRIEILRGPQGTLFGRNTTGGAVSVTSLRPSDEFEHHARVKAGSYDELNWGLSSSGPITDNLGYRVYAEQNKRDGFVDNIGGGDIYSKDYSAFGAQLDWNISDTLNLWVNFRTYETDVTTLGGNFGGHLLTEYEPDIKSRDGYLLSEAYQWDKKNPAVVDPYKVDVSDIGRAVTDDVYRFAAHLTWDLEPLTIKYIGGYTEGDFENSDSDLGYTSNPDNRVVEHSGQTSETQSHEIQFISPGDGAFNWVAGLYYFKSDKDQPYRISSEEAEYMDSVLPVESFDPSLITPNPGRTQYFQQGVLESESTAVYADVNYQFNDAWKLTVGLRYSEDEKTGFEQQRLVADTNIYGVSFPSYGFPETCCGWLVTDETVANRTIKDDWSDTSGRVVLDWTPNDTSLIYASVSTGYKSGGFRLGNLDEDPSFDSEDLTSYEIGYKGSFNDTIQLNAAAYFYDYKDMQVVVPALNDVNLPVPQVVNADKAEVKGIELEAIWLATENLEFMANYSYIDGEYTDFCCFVDTVTDEEGAPQDLSGTKLTQTPENKFYVNATYNWYTPSAGDWALSGSYAWVDERQYEVFESPLTTADSYERVDAMLTWFSPNEDWRVILSGKNLTDDFTWENLERANSAALVGVPNLPRTYGLEVQYTFR